MALNLQGIRTALKQRLDAGIARDTNVYAQPVAEPVLPAISILPAAEYVTYFDTFTSAGTAVVNLVLEVLIGGETPDAQVAMDDYLSAGSGFGSSIHDAIEADSRLGNVVESCHALTATIDDPVADQPLRAVLPVQIVTRKA